MMTDRLFLQLNNKWALAADRQQWVVMRWKGTAQGWRLISFVASNKGVLMRVLSERGVKPTPEAEAVLDTLPDTFRKWIRLHKATTTAASNQPANLGRAA